MFILRDDVHRFQSYFLSADELYVDLITTVSFRQTVSHIETQSTTIRMFVVLPGFGMFLLIT